MVLRKSRLLQVLRLLLVEKNSKMQVSSVSKALEGAAAGVQVINTSGQPGENAK